MRKVVESLVCERRKKDKFTEKKRQDLYPQRDEYLE